MESLAPYTTVGSASVVIIAALVTWFRWVRPFLHRARHDIISGRDALLGRDEIRDSITGAVVLPALPGMGIRMDRNEQQMAAVVDAVAQIAPALVQLAESHKRLDEHDGQIAANARNIADLKSAYMERIAGHIDSAAAWSAVEAVAKNDEESK